MFSELVLLDDNFSTLVYAIREGRTIYENLKKTIVASLTSNIGELAIVLLGLLGIALFDWPIPIVVVQILAIDLLAEILPLTALTFDPGSSQLMTSPPRSLKEHILNKSTMLEILFLGLIMGGLGFINFIIFMQYTGTTLTDNHELYSRATTLSYATIVGCQYINILSRRYRFTSIFNRNIWSSSKMLWSIAISTGLTMTAIYTPGINGFLRFSPLTAIDWAWVLAAASIFLVAHEAIKTYRRSRRSVNVDRQL